MYLCLLRASLETIFNIFQRIFIFLRKNELIYFRKVKIFWKI
jgi:hypothetical protein